VTDIAPHVERDFEPAPEQAVRSGRVWRNRLFKSAMLLSMLVAFGTLAVLLADTVITGWPALSTTLLTDPPSSLPEEAGARPAILATLYLGGLVLLLAVPIGILTAIYLEEYADRTRWWNKLIEVNIQNLAAVPSIVYGILGLAFLVRGPLSMGNVLVAGGLTLGLLVLPVVIVAGREAIRAVPPSIREGSMALGATQWQTIWKQTLPAAVPGIATGVILSLSRAIGETAPLIVVGAALFATSSPSSPFDDVTALPIQIFGWVSDPQPEFKALAASAIIVLMVILLAMNAVAIWLRNRYEKKW
jgi:phosphate transport system permease protein